MTNLTNTQVNQINKMNRASQKASLGTAVLTLQTEMDTQQAIAGTSGSLVVTTAMMSGSRVPIIVPSCTKGKIWQYTRSGSPLTTIKELAWTAASGSLVLSASSGSMLVGDEVYYLMW